MREFEILCGRDVCVSINGNPLFQAESVEVRTLSDIHCVRSCFKNQDIALIRGKKEYKATLTALKFKKPFENCNFYDLDNFTVAFETDGTKIVLKGCVWSDFLSAANRESFREKLSITALDMKVEETE